MSDTKSHFVDHTIVTNTCDAAHYLNSGNHKVFSDSEILTHSEWVQEQFDAMNAKSIMDNAEYNFYPAAPSQREINQSANFTLALTFVWFVLWASATYLLIKFVPDEIMTYVIYSYWVAVMISTACFYGMICSPDSKAMLWIRKLY